jgi:hypothetical protein
MLLSIRSSLIAFLVCLLTSVVVVAQQDAGGLVVSVRDPNGAVVPGAKVVVTNVDTNQRFEGATIDTGDFTVSPLRPGRYKTSVQREGFQTAVTEAINVGAQQIPRLDIRLAVGSVNESVTVSAATTLLQTVDVSKQNTIAGVIKNELPVLDRNYNQLSKLTVGVTSGTPQ